MSESLANRKVLVLNKSWQPINVVTLEQALKKVSNTYRDGTPKGKIIDCRNDFQTMTWEDWSKIKPAEGEEFMRSPTAVARIPTVIMVTKYNKVRRESVNYNRRTVYKRDNYTCQYCGDRPPVSELSMDHVKPKSKGGLTTWENIVVACTACNSYKADRTPEEAGMTLRRKPFKPTYGIYPSDVKIKDWETFLGEAYWNVPLENDMDE